jgi:hypothetical protein
MRSICLRSPVKACAQHRVRRASGQNALVDDPGKRLNLRAAQVVLQGLRLRDRCRFRQGHQNDAGVGRVLQPHQRRHQAPAAVAFKLAHHLAVVGTGGIHQQQGVTRRRRVQHHKGAARFAHHARERVEDGHFFGAGRAQVFQHQRFLLRVQLGAFGGHDLVHVALCLHDGVDAVHPQARVPRPPVFRSSGRPGL